MVEAPPEHRLDDNPIQRTTIAGLHSPGPNAGTLRTYQCFGDAFDDLPERHWTMILKWFYICVFDTCRMDQALFYNDLGRDAQSDLNMI